MGIDELIDRKIFHAFASLGVDLSQFKFEICDTECEAENLLQTVSKLKNRRKARTKTVHGECTFDSRIDELQSDSLSLLQLVGLESDMNAHQGIKNKLINEEEEELDQGYGNYALENLENVEYMDKNRGCNVNEGLEDMDMVGYSDAASIYYDGVKSMKTVPIEKISLIDDTSVPNLRITSKKLKKKSSFTPVRKTLKRRTGNHKELFNFPTTGERDPKVKFQCTECIKGFKSDQSLRQHLRRHDEKNQERAWFCFMCEDVGFKHYDDLKTHHQIRHEKRKLTCPICGKVYYSQHEKRYNIHVNEHENPSKHLFCVGCGEKFLTKGPLDAHMKQLGPYHDGRCAICKDHIKFDTWEEYKSHVRAEHAGDFKFKCGWCPTVLESEALRKCHIREAHHGTGIMSTWKRNNKNKLSSKGKHQVFCETCGKTIKSGRSSYLIHMEDVHGEYDLACNDCHSVYRFKHSNSLQRHIEKCHVKYTCDLCGVQGPRRMYDKHMLSFHTPDHLKPFQCTTCDPPKGFAVKQSLRDHMNTHTGMKPYKCKQCDAAFNSSGNLAAHKRSVHLGIKRQHLNKAILI